FQLRWSRADGNQTEGAQEEDSDPDLLDLHHRAVTGLREGTVRAGTALRRPDGAHARGALRPAQGRRTARRRQAASLRRTPAVRPDAGHRAVRDAPGGRGGGEEGGRGAPAPRPSGVLGVTASIASRPPTGAYIARFSRPGQDMVSRNALSSTPSTSCGTPWSSVSRPPAGRANVRPSAC